MYKDKKGIIHFSDQKPPEKHYKIMYLPAGSGAMATDKKQDLDKKGMRPSAKETSGRVSPDTLTVGSGLPLPNPYTDPAKIIKDAKALKKQVDDNNKNQKKMMDDLNR
ncbi:MAG: hypothetical protein M0Z56_06340 [Desulfobacteraceae bacterium]|nr:hypothetical protein [Desulfobacteraceae bacterium]